MSRGLFPAVTLVLSAAVFAGVWTATGAAIAPVTDAGGPDRPPLPATVDLAAAGHGAEPNVRAPRARPAARHRRRSALRLRPVSVAPRRETAAAALVWYPGCRAVRAAGAAPLYRGQPGYRPEMDGDGDGIACEPYRGG